MPAAPLQVAIIVGSTREGRFGGTVGHWCATQAAQRTDMVLDLINLVDVDLPMVLPVTPAPAEQSYVEQG